MNSMTPIQSDRQTIRVQIQQARCTLKAEQGVKSYDDQEQRIPRLPRDGYESGW